MKGWPDAVGARDDAPGKRLYFEPVSHFPERPSTTRPLAEAEASNLVRQVACGERHSFEVLYLALRPKMIATALPLLAGDHHDAEDAVDEAFLDVWRKAADFGGRGSAIGWIRCLVRNKAIDTVRRQARLVCADQGEFHDIAANPTDSPEAVCLDRNEQSRLWCAVDSLGARQREVIRLFYMEELSVEEIAIRVGVPVGTVKSRLFHARKALLAVL